MLIKSSKRRGQRKDGIEDGEEQVFRTLPNKKHQHHLTSSERGIDDTTSPIGPKRKRGRLSTSQPDFNSTGNKSSKEAGVQAARTGQRERSPDTQEQPRVRNRAVIKSPPKRKRTSNRNGLEDSQNGSFATDVADSAHTPSATSGRRGRSSQTETEVQALNDEATKSLYQSKPAQQTTANATRSKPEPDPLFVVSRDDSRGKSGHSKKRIEKVQTSSQRRGRSSLSESEVAAIYNEAVWGKHTDREVMSPMQPITNTAEYLPNNEYALGTVLQVETATSSLSKEGKKVSKRGDQQRTNGRSQTDRVESVDTKKRHLPNPSSQIHAVESSATTTSKARKAPQPLKKNGKSDKTKSGELHVQEKTGELYKEMQHSERGRPEREEAPSYQKLSAVIRQVSRGTINSKWEKLPQGGVERVSQMLYDIQRPTVIHLNDERRRTQASTALQMVSRRLVKKISKIPFPQGTRSHREDDFDFEKTLDYNRTLESILTPASHANKLLEAELIKESALLEAEKSTLEELTTNAKSESSLRIEAGRKLHSLLQTDGFLVEIEGLDHISSQNGPSLLTTALNVGIQLLIQGK